MRAGSARDHMLQSISLRLAGALASACVLLAPGGAQAAELTLAFKASEVPEIRDAQTRLVQSYAYVKYYYVDDTFNGLDWDAAYKSALEESYAAESGAEVDAITAKLLKRLGDPFTRLLDTEATKTYKAEKQGQIRSFGIGADCSAAAATQTCSIDFVQSGSAAAEAGLRVGDQVVAFQGAPIDEASSRNFKQALQQRDRKDLQIAVRREETGSASKSVANNDAEFVFPDDAPVEPNISTVSLNQRAVDVNPVQFATMPLPSGEQAGYVRVAVFADTAVKNVENALKQLDTAKGLVLDLRDNPGGTVGPGLDIAGELLPNGSGFVSVEGREMRSERIAVNSNNTRPTVAGQPTVVLVNNNTASTSEMLASALHAKGATLVGDKTLGKGRTQQVFELPKGELLFVSVLKYRGAAGEPIDQTGLKPDHVCAPQATGEVRYDGGRMSSDEDLRSDPCIDLAMNLLADKSPQMSVSKPSKNEIAEVADRRGDDGSSSLPDKENASSDDVSDPKNRNASSGSEGGVSVGKAANNTEKPTDASSSPVPQKDATSGDQPRESSAASPKASDAAVSAGSIEHDSVRAPKPSEATASVGEPNDKRASASAATEVKAPTLESNSKGAAARSTTEMKGSVDKQDDKRATASSEAYVSAGQSSNLQDADASNTEAAKTADVADNRRESAVPSKEIAATSSDTTASAAAETAAPDSKPGDQSAADRSTADVAALDVRTGNETASSVRTEFAEEESLVAP